MHAKKHLHSATITFIALLAASFISLAQQCKPLSVLDGQKSKLRITNQCQYPIWIQQDHIYKTPDPIVVKIQPRQSYDYQIPDEGLASTRFWPKARCNQYGYNCAIGESVGVPSAIKQGQQTAKTIFDPDINSKFEATWGCVHAPSQPTRCASNPSDPKTKLNEWTYWDATAVDGYTFAFAIKVKGKNIECYSQETGEQLCDPNIDCGKLTPTQCPNQTDLNESSVPHSDERFFDIDLRAKSFTDPNLNIGCFSPCAKLTSQQWGGLSKQLDGLEPQSDRARLYCCPTQAGEPWSVDPEVCRQGPAATSEYLQSVQETQQCPAYAFAYDDAKGLVQCHASTQYEVIFCPSGNSLPLPAHERQPTTFCNPQAQPEQRCPGNQDCPDCGETMCPCPPQADA